MRLWEMMDIAMEYTRRLEIYFRALVGNDGYFHRVHDETRDLFPSACGK